MTLERLSEILHMVPVAKLGEVTMEAAPGTLTSEKVRAWRGMGVNRVSLGVQSFVDAELQQSGRRHSSSIVEADMALLRAAGINNINLDLIAGLPHQNRASWEHSLNWIERLAPPHVSVYIFEVDEDSRLGKEMTLGGVRYGAGLMPGDDLIADLYEMAVARLLELGIQRYEISNFARLGHESLHNLKYWQLQPYLGFGLDSHSFYGGERFSSSDTMTAYLADPLARMSAGTSDPAEEHFFVGLRLDLGIQPTDEEWRRFAMPINKWIRAGMLERAEDRLRLTKRAALLSNEIFADFLESELEHA